LRTRDLKRDMAFLLEAVRAWYYGRMVVTDSS
jgi:hypothetical protein